MPTTKRFNSGLKAAEAANLASLLGSVLKGIFTGGVCDVSWKAKKETFKKFTLNNKYQLQKTPLKAFCWVFHMFYLPGFNFLANF